MKALLSNILSAICLLVLLAAAVFYTCVTIIGYVCNIYSIFAVVYILITDIGIIILSTMWFIAILRSYNGKKEE